MKTQQTQLALPELEHAIACTVVAGSAQLALHRVIRQAVFVDEQGLFEDTDADALDKAETTVHCLGYVGRVAAGAVRLYPLDAAAGLWQGDRLAVLPNYRSWRLGAPLVRFAVQTAAERAGTSMIAHVQLNNVRFFRHLGWSCDGDVETYVGVAHQPMRIDW